MAAPAYQRYTPEEYLAFEQEVEYKNEYIDGQIIAMTGASPAHNTIVHNLGRILGNQLLDEPCYIWATDMRVKIQESENYTYSDQVVVCGEPDLEHKELESLLNPTVIVEVLSPSTEKYDRGAKFGYYRQLLSLREYILISQEKVLVEHYVLEDESWRFTVAHELSDVVRLPSIGCELSLADVYRKVQFETAERPGGDEGRAENGG